MEVLNNVNMGTYTSFRTGGMVEKLVIVNTKDELIEALENNASQGYIFLGNGTNTLFASDNYKGLVVKLGEAFDFISVDGDIITAGGGTLLSRLANTAAKEGLTGLEFAGGIPGSVGGALFMNAGAYDGEMKDVVLSADILFKNKDTGEWEEKEVPCEELDLSYRHSLLMEEKGIVLSVKFKLQEGDKAEIRDKMKDFSERRSSKQPLEYPSAGSFFKRPPGRFAGKLIEDSGLAGASVGEAEVSSKHCGFIINKGGATPSDILKLMEKVQETVYHKYGVSLEPEIRIIK